MFLTAQSVVNVGPDCTARKTIRIQGQPIVNVGLYCTARKTLIIKGEPIVYVGLDFTGKKSSRKPIIKGESVVNI